MVKIMANIAVNEDQGHDSIQPYGMHVSSRYLDLTRRKLELTRLPRELQLPDSRRWEYGTPKAVLEPLIDFWLKQYDWRTQEALFNNALPQFRTTIRIPLRVHFVHKRSKHRNAIPLLFCHSWPSSFVELYKIVDALTDPVSLPSYGIGAQQAFHVVAPSIPGFGFSDASPVEGFGLRETAGAFDEVMSRLGYAKRGYVAHGAGWGFRICRALALYYPQHCLAVHTTNPSLPQPTIRRNPMLYLKYQIASFTHAKFSYLNFGYIPADFAPTPQTLKNTQSNELGASDGGFDAALASQYSQRSQTVSYSLCDSPIGLLACMLDALHSRSAGSTSHSQSPFLSLSELSQQASQQASRKASQQPATVDDEIELQIQPAPPAQIVLSPWHSETNGQDYTWAPTEILSWTMMQWLPGPEAGLRWLRQASHDSSHANPAFWETYSTVPLGISQFRPTRGSTESPLMWAEAVQNLAWAKRHPRSARWPAWEAPDLLVLDLRECFGSWVESGVVRVARDDAEDN